MRSLLINKASVALKLLIVVNISVSTQLGRDKMENEHSKPWISTPLVESRALSEAAKW